MRTGNDIKVWDSLIRVFHWTLVVAFTIAYFSAEEESATHIYSGYAVLGLVLFRIVWGFVGSRHARFADFLYGPATVIDYSRGVLAGHPRRYLGHNPLGGLMVIALLAGLAVVTYSGLMVYAIEEGAGPLAGLVAAGQVRELSPVPAARADEGEYGEAEGEGGGADEASEEFWEEIHEVSTNITLVLIALHILGVFLGSFQHRENLIRAMFTGRKPE